MKRELVSLMMGLLTVSAAAVDSTFTQPVKLKGEKGDRPAFYLEDGKHDVQGRAVRASGKAWSSVQITHEGVGIRLKKEMRQMLTGRLALADKSFSCTVWVKPLSVQKPYGMIVANTTRPPCWGIRMLPVEPEGSFKAEVYYNWGIQGVPGMLMCSKDVFQTGKWYFYTLTVDREQGAMNFYIDGKLVSSAKMPKETPAFRDTFTISANPWFLDGHVYDVTFYPSVLSAEQITTQFKAGETSLKDEKK